MPDFYVDDLDISPSEFYNACSRREKERLIEIFEEDGYTVIPPGKYEESVPGRQSDFAKSLGILKGCKMMLTLEEEDFIINLAEKFKHVVVK